MLFPAASLINGTTITWHEAREFNELEFFHVLFDSHDALYVEGAPCESLLTGIARVTAGITAAASAGSFRRFDPGLPQQRPRLSGN